MGDVVVVVVEARYMPSKEERATLPRHYRLQLEGGAHYRRLSAQARPMYQ